jgi:hypothetical protein
MKQHRALGTQIEGSAPPRNKPSPVVAVAKAVAAVAVLARAIIEWLPRP